MYKSSTEYLLFVTYRGSDRVAALVRQIVYIICKTKNQPFFKAGLTYLALLFDLDWYKAKWYGCYYVQRRMPLHGRLIIFLTHSNKRNVVDHGEK
jgi:hypothetical protein